MKANMVRLALAALVALLAGCVSPVQSQKPESSLAASELSGALIVFAAASLTDAFGALGEAFEAEHPNAQIQFNFAGSQQLAQQLALGARADVFASADWTQMETAVNSDRIMPGKPVSFAANQLVIVVAGDNPAAIGSVSDLDEPGIKLIIAAEEVPVGRYTQQFLTNTTDSPDFSAGYAEALLANVVSYEQNVRAVLSKVMLGEADAGIIYDSDFTQEQSNQVISLPIPDSVNASASYPIAALDDSGQPELAEAFIDFVRSPAGQSILADQGFLPATDRNR